MAFLDTIFHVLEFDQLYYLRNQDLPRHCVAAFLVSQPSVCLTICKPLHLRSHKASVPYLHDGGISEHRLSVEAIGSFRKFVALLSCCLTRLK